jgi:hypothetical protein
MTMPAESIARAADLLEGAARAGGGGQVMGATPSDEREMIRCRRSPGYGIVWGVSELPGFESASAGHTVPAVGPLSAANQPATKADLYAAVDALRADMRELMDAVQKLVQEADSRVTEAERAQDANRNGLDDAW